MPVSESLYVPVLPVRLEREQDVLVPERAQDERAADVCVLVPDDVSPLAYADDGTGLVPHDDVSPLASPRAHSTMLKDSWCGKRKSGASGSSKVRLEVAASRRVPLHVPS
jgi:hypothetical protein